MNLTKLEATELSLPTGYVEEQEKVELRYWNLAIYNFLLKTDSVYHFILKEKNTSLFGVGIA